MHNLDNSAFLCVFGGGRVEVGGGWRAFRKQRMRRVVGFGLVALLPIGICAAGVLIAMLTSSSPFPVTFSVNP